MGVKEDTSLTDREIEKMKTKEELNALKEEVDTLNKKLAELSKEELAQVFGGTVINTPNGCETIEAAGASIEDPDMAEEATEMTQALVMQQRAQAMMASSKQNKPNVFGLLQ